MRKSNKVKQLHRVKEHRNAMLKNLLRSLFYHERVISTIPRIKVLKQLAEKIITKARYNLQDDIEASKKVHNIRLVTRYISDKALLNKIFNEIALCFKDRPGGYTRAIKIGNRTNDKAPMALLEFVDRLDAPKTNVVAKRKPVEVTASGK